MEWFIVNQGWICPVCNRGLAPGVTECNHGGMTTTPQYIHPPFFAPSPQYPFGPSRTADPLPYYIPPPTCAIGVGTVTVQ